jgi:uncharacterized repeat protein (TIGR04138 family)
MDEQSFEQAMQLIFAKDRRYLCDAYLFVREALDYTQRTVASQSRNRPRHVRGPQLLEGIRQFALEEFGPMALAVFAEWGVHCCRDFGEIVFNMVEVGWLTKTHQDRLADFEGGYDFDEAFRAPFLPSYKLAARGRAANPAPA